ncbi:unnamed protein product [Caenorhabditis auriculariae]|uniref:Uncharacterized protein n=1 Tax=Caenorhabditis auriculariae TaxID=2777116 RepID=A0A8S1H585_9PELO|nr:unnamed protein product [Caenorhabditis auriculariae]
MGTAAQCSNDGAYFFGEAYTTFYNSAHVVVAGQVILLIEISLLFLYVVVVPLTVGFFDTVSFFQVVVVGTIWGVTAFAISRHKHQLLMPFMVLKACEIIMYAMFLVVAAVLAVIRKSTLLQLMQWRITTIDHSNQGAHIVGLLLFFLLQMVYNTIALQTIYDVYEYFSHRSRFLFTQERNQAYQYFF